MVGRSSWRPCLPCPGSVGSECPSRVARQNVGHAEPRRDWFCSRCHRVGAAEMTGPAEVADAVVLAIRSGDTAALRQLLADHPGVASAPLGGRHKSRTPLSAVTDGPGYFPHGPETVRVLVEAGADPNARQPGEETALHWAASSDDWHVAAALIDAGADINAPDGSIGTPLENAVGYGCWDVAR